MRDIARPPTIETVAARAGVGRSTVSRVLNGAPQVSQRTRASVEQAIADLGYVPNHAARTLAMHRADTVVLVLTGAKVDAVDPANLVDFLGGIHRGLVGSALALRLCWAQSSTELIALGHRLGAERVDGALMLASRDCAPLASILAGYGVPTVVGGEPRRAPRLAAAEAYTVCIDYTAGVRLAVAYLLAHGRRRIAAIHGSGEAGSLHLAAYRETIQAFDVADPALAESTGRTPDGGFAAMRRLLHRNPALDGVVAVSDLVAVGALRALRSADRRVPADVAVVGLGDSPVAITTDPPLTTVRPPAAELGRQMARLLLARISGDADAPASVALAPQLICRQSA
jgi:DNA-binding LacI/PurR family transcriptional regulator